MIETILKTTPDGRDYATMTLGKKTLLIHPDAFEALDAMIGNGFRSDGQINLHIAGGRITDVKLNNCPARILRYYAERQTG